MKRRSFIPVGLTVATVLIAMVSVRGADPTNAPARTDYASFRMVVERNIFNASRSGRSQSRDRDNRRPTRVETFGLVGTMTYDKGPLAFFDGSSSEFRKALKPGAAIAGYQLEAIHPEAVTLRHASNSFELRLGSQMRREDDGEWKVAGQFDSAAASSGGSGGGFGRGTSGSGGGTGAGASGGSASGGDVSEVLKRLMEKREKESQ